VKRRAAAEYVALGAMALHLTLAPMLLGGVLPWTVVCIAASSLGCLGLTAFAYRPALAVAAPPLLWAALGLLVWTAVQVMPIPCGVAAALAPESANSARAAQAALGASPAQMVCTLTRDPAATQEEIVKGFAIVATLAAAWLLAAQGARREVFWMIAASTLAMSLVAIGHGLAGLDEVFGVYKPVEVNRQLLLAPLVNSNNLGAFAALGVPLWVGLTFRTAHREVRWLGRIAIVIIAATAILSLSRGAVGQLAIEVLLVFACLRIARRRPRQGSSERTWPRALGIAGAVIGAACLALYIDGQLVTHEFENRDLSKLGLLARSFTFAWQHGWIGIGRGAFSSAFVGVEGTTVRFGYAENFLIQWASEWGFPATLLWLSVLALALVRTVRGSRSLAQLCACSALLAYAAQNLLDLGLELVGIAVVAAALLGAAVAPAKLDHSRQPRPASLWIYAAGILCAGALALGTLGLRVPRQSISALDAHLREQLRVQDRTGFRRTLADAVRLHPAEPLFAVLAAGEAIRHRDRTTGRWINHAMQLAPNWGAPHALAFQWLWRIGQREQALIELRQAAEIDPRPWSAQVCSLAGRKGDPILLAAPSGKWRATYLENAVWCLEPGDSAAKAIEDVLLREFPERPLAHERAAYRLASGGDVEEGVAMIDALLERQPDNPSARAMRAAMLVRGGRLTQAIAQVERDLPLVQTKDKLSLLRSQGLAYARLEDAAAAQRIVYTVRSLSSGSVASLAESYAFEAAVQLELRNMNTALAAFREAYNIQQETTYLLQVAELAGRLGDRVQMVWAYVQLCAREPANGSYCATRDLILSPRPREIR
jgi:tetratricopeptide (TPR) repeat protein